MIFNSITFILFLTLVVVLYWILPKRIKMWMLLIASCIFYGFWKWEYLFVMFLSALTDYYTSLMIYKTPIENKSKRKYFLYLTLAINLGLLFYFKYLYFFTTNFNNLLIFTGSTNLIPIYKIVLPFGISFYTFETISYTVDVYRGLLKPEKKFINYALFVTFFPKLVAGPIQRASELIPQLKISSKFNIELITDGLKRVLLGLFLKVVIADNISPIVDEGFALSISSLSAIDVWTLAFLFGFQIYFDFSAYSHIAVGSAKLMGINIPENFNYPYIAKSFKNFWKRWHISLSSWIRDYLYLPLSGVKVIKTTGMGGIGEGLEKINTNKNKALFLTWAIMGLWHGANWTFVFWGLYHATMIFFERKLKNFRSRIFIFKYSIVSWFITLPLVMLSWIPFRAKNLTDTLLYFSKVISIKNYLFLGMRENTYLVTFLLFLLFYLNYLLSEVLYIFYKKYIILINSINIIKYTFIIILVYTFLRPISQFIYFQF